MIHNDNRYIIYFRGEDKIKKLNDFFEKKSRPFLKDNGGLYIEVINNDATTGIFNNSQTQFVINFKSINDNNYPKIHILPWNV